MAQIADLNELIKNIKTVRDPSTGAYVPLISISDMKTLADASFSDWMKAAQADTEKKWLSLPCARVKPIPYNLCPFV